MKILVICANYPPHHSGGYEIRCRDIVDALAVREHALLVLTSQRATAARVPFREAVYPIRRRLRFDAGGGIINRMTERRWSYALGMLLVLVRELWFGWRDTAFVDKQISRFQPDVIYLSHVTNFTKVLVPYLANMPLVYDEGGSGLIHLWTDRGAWYKFTDEYSSSNAALSRMKSGIVGVVRSLSRDRVKAQRGWPARMRIIFNSEINYKNALAKDVPVNGAKVIHSGVDTEKFRFRSRSSLSAPVRIVVPGRIEPRKGQIDGVRLLAKLGECGVKANMVFVGGVWSDSYYKELADEVRRLRLEEKVRLMSMIPQDELAALYQKADICFFPSYYRTGFSRVPLEAMACGCVVISYGNEGSDEIIRNGQTGFLVEPGDLSEITRIVEELTSNPGAVEKMVSAARKEVEEHRSMQTYVDRIEEFVRAAVASGRLA